MPITPKWKNHPLTKKGVVELVPTDWVFDFRGPDVTPIADLKDGTIVNLEELWKNIEQDGLFDPLIIRVGRRNKKFRLEAGNHRIQVMKKHGVTFVPVTVQVQEDCGPHVTNTMNNATHNFDFLDEANLTALENGYFKPTSIFSSLKEKIQPF